MPNMQKKISTANDNIPVDFSNRSQVLPAMRPTPTRHEPLRNPQNTSAKPLDHNPTVWNRLGVFCWLGAIAATLFAFGQNLDGLPRMLSSTFLIWTGLWVGYIGQEKNYPRLSDIGIFSAVIGLVFGLFTAVTNFAVPLSLSDSLSVIVLATLGISALLNSRIALIASISAALIMSALHLSNITLSVLAMMIYPAIWAMQIFLSSRLQSRLAIFATIFSGYYWLGGLALEQFKLGHIAPSLLACSLFIVGALQYRTGKAMNDEAAFGSSLHTSIGWLVAFLGAATIAHMWLFPESSLWQNTLSSPLFVLGWKAATAVILGLIFLTGIIRIAHNQLTLTRAVLITLISALIPLTVWFKPLLDAALYNPAFDYDSPVIGLSICAALCASAVGFALNGVRRDKFIMVLSGLAGIAGLAFLLMRPEILTVENIIVFTVAAIVSFGVGGWIAGKNLYLMRHQRPYTPAPHNTPMNRTG